MFYKLILLTLLTCCYATPPPGYVKPPEPLDKNPPNYKYGYTIDDKKGAEQGKQESREGPFSSGRYYVQQGGANQNVQYVTDEWGYHPLVTYSSGDQHSHTSASFALGEKAVQALRANRPQDRPITKLEKQHPKSTVATPFLIPPPLKNTKLHQVPKGSFHRPNYIPLQGPEYFGQNGPKGSQNPGHGPRYQLPKIGNLHSSPNANNGFFLGDLQSPLIFANVPQVVVGSNELPQPAMYVQGSLVGSNELPQAAMLVSGPAEGVPQVLEGPHGAMLLQFPFYPGINLDQSNLIPFQYIPESLEQPKLPLVEQKDLENHLENQEKKVEEQASQKKEENSQNQNSAGTQENSSPTPTSALESEQLSGNLLETSTQVLENQALFSQEDQKVKYSTGAENQIDENFGAKLNAKLQNTRPQKFEDQSLIDKTKDLVNGLDVLNINNAANPRTEKPSFRPNFRGQNHFRGQKTFSSSSLSKEGLVSATRTRLVKILNHEKVPEKFNFEKNPIIVDDLEEDYIVSTTEGSLVSTTSSLGPEIHSNSIGPTESSIVITPRPVSSTFLAPITAGVSLQNDGSSVPLEAPVGGSDSSSSVYVKNGAITHNTVISHGSKDNTIVEIQKSVPYYIGKVEYVDNKGNNPFLSVEKEPERIISYLQDEKFQVPQPLEDVPKAEALVQEDRSPEELSVTLPIGNNLDRGAQKNQVQEIQTKIIEKPVVQIVEKEVPVHIPVEIPVPYPVEKQVHIPVEKIVEKPVEVTKIVEKTVPIHVPQPYPVEVEKIVEKKVPVEVTRFVDKPYPVHVPVPQPVAVPVEVEKIVEKVVPQPYRVEVPIEVQVPVKVPYPHPVPVTKYIEKPYPVEKIVEKTVPKYIDRPYPVHIKVPVPTPIAVPVEVKIPYPYPFEKPNHFGYSYASPNLIQKAASINVPVVLPPTKLQPLNLENSYNYKVPSFDLKVTNFNLQNGFHGDLHKGLQNGFHKGLQSGFHGEFQKGLQSGFQNGLHSGPQNGLHSGLQSIHSGFQNGVQGGLQGHNFDLQSESLNVQGFQKVPLFSENQLPNLQGYQYAPKYQVSNSWNKNCDFHLPQGDLHASKTTQNEYIGLTPPLPSRKYLPTFNSREFNANFKRKPRQSFGNLRVEYGFKPPLIPSVETDEHGTPLEKDDEE